jgi:hypothetical protein
MIYVRDNFFTYKNFDFIKNHCTQNEFKIHKAGEKEFSVIPTPNEIIPLLQMEGYDLTLSFIRKAYKGFDNDLRIHADNIINGQKTSVASVIYINNIKGVTPNGTAFYKHLNYGFKLPENISNEEFDRLIKEDSNDISKWEKTDFISARPNRLLVYDSNYFHSKFPKEIEEGERIVLVSFYKLQDS